jgi:hypothetical protein
MPAEHRPFALFPLAVVALFSMLLAFSSYGNPFPFMGTLYEGELAKRFVFADALVSLYLLIGIFKRQQLTVWLLIAYNTLDICNAWINLALIPAAEYARLAVIPVSQDEMRFNTLFASLVLMLLNLYLYRNRRHFDNYSPYLF